MYLKKIEVQGFKSFAQKIDFRFQSGITAIVGPNGSGKSNVADAVRWVLGEQSAKQLRGSNMQDVIFAGTENRRPQGFAYVAITFDNSDHRLQLDYDEVTVSRRVYRSGESEYLINGHSCRLRDVNELFYDTGIGKEGYSIIGQGQIDKILSGKPEDRRELFDEAAGIVKFKKRKAQALKKLESEHESLVRVRDILGELERQNGPLKNQSEKARQYLKYKEELKNYDVNMFLIEDRENRVRLSELEGNIAAARADLEQSRGKAEQLRMEYEKLSAVNKTLEEEINEERERISRNGLKKENLEGQIGLLREQIHFEENRREEFAGRLTQLQKENEEKLGQKKAFARRQEMLAAQLKEGQQEREGLILENARSAERISALDAHISSDKEQQMRLMNDRTGLAARKQRYLTMTEQAQMRKSEIYAKQLRSKSDEAVQRELVERLEETAEAIKGQNAKLNEQLQCLTLKQKEQEEQLLKLTRLQNERQQEYHTLQTRLESLQNIAERYEGYGNSIRRVMECRSRMPGIVGVVADLISVDKRYEAAIETALGGSIQNVVTDSEITAKHCIEYLKKNRFGRATFLPLTTIDGSRTLGVKDGLDEPGVIGIASRLVSVRAEYQALAGYLLGRIMVVDHMDHGLALAKKHKFSFRIVTLEGDLINAGGSMTGGAYKNSSNLLGRKRELEELEEGMKKALRRFETGQEELAEETENKKELEEALAQCREELADSQVELARSQMDWKQGQDKLEEMQEGGRELIEELNQLKEQLQEIDLAREALSEEEEALEQRNQEYAGAIDDFTLQLTQERERKEELSRKLEEQNLSCSAADQQLRFLQENESRIREELEKNRREAENIEADTRQSVQLSEEKERQIRQTEESIRMLTAEMERQNETAGAKAADREKNADRQNRMLAERERLNEVNAGLDKEMFRLEHQKEQAETRMEKAVEYLWSEYELTPSETEKLRDDTLNSLPELRELSGELRKQIKSLGNVNVNAIEEYRELSERYEFMKTQHDDLVAAEERLNQVIVELDEGMRRQFEEQFRLIKKEFDKVFKELFGGGQGTLKLLADEKDILEAGIQIIAQPPGKKLQNMMQLSGGEKALTAISLLFAIQNLKPSPFCLLDEIEAALDDSNVVRFAKYLDKLKKFTQFIVITHRRGTMLIADQLYGITMQEKGVSSLVSVDLTEQAS